MTNMKLELLEELKPCPFCGGKAAIKSYSHEYFTIICKNLFCLFNDTETHKNKIELIDFWNTRTGEK